MTRTALPIRARHAAPVLAPIRPALLILPNLPNLPNLLILPALLLLLASCDHKELCFDHDAHAPHSRLAVVADYECDWEYTYAGATDWAAAWPALGLDLAYDDLRPALPTGLRILDYPPGGGVSTFNLDPAGGILSLTAGNHSLLFHNNGTQYILFDELGSYASARATTRARSRATYLGSPYSDEPVEVTVNAPDMLFGHYVDIFESVAALQEQSLAVTLRPLTFTYLILYGFASGGERVDIARGALAGMAKEVYLNSGRTATEPATILFECDDVNGSGALAKVLSFGVPDFPNDRYARSERSYGLNLEVKLRDGTVADFDFDVTEQVAAQPRGGVIRVDGIEIPTTGGSGSMFSVDVIDWGDDHNIDLPI